MEASVELEQRQPLAPAVSEDQQSDASPRYHDGNPLGAAQAHALYCCHALSTWNARMYEFAAVSKNKSELEGLG